MVGDAMRGGTLLGVAAILAVLEYLSLQAYDRYRAVGTFALWGRPRKRDWTKVQLRIASPHCTAAIVGILHEHHSNAEAQP